MNVDTPSWSVQYIDELCISSYLFFFLRYFSIRDPSVLNSFSSIEFSFRVFFLFLFFLRCNAFFVVHLRVFSTRSSSVIRIESLSLSRVFQDCETSCAKYTTRRKKGKSALGGYGSACFQVASKKIICNRVHRTRRLEHCLPSG